MSESPGDLKREYASRPDAELDPTNALYELPAGTEVVDRSGAKVGEVVRVYRPVTVDEQGSMASVAYIRVRRGLLHADIWVPSDVVTSAGDGRIQLDVDRSVIGDMAWDRPYNIAADEGDEPRSGSAGPG